MELRVRREDDLDECERLARAVHGADGYPPRCADDLRLFVSTPDALGAGAAHEPSRLYSLAGAPTIEVVACPA